MSKNATKNRDPRCTSVIHEIPILKFWALSYLNSVLWRGYGPKIIIINQGSHFRTGLLNSSRHSKECP